MCLCHHQKEEKKSKRIKQEADLFCCLNKIPRAFEGYVNIKQDQSAECVMLQVSFFFPVAL